jgi:hypothetical protein
MLWLAFSTVCFGIACTSVGSAWFRLRAHVAASTDAKAQEYMRLRHPDPAERQRLCRDRLRRNRRRLRIAAAFAIFFAALNGYLIAKSHLALAACAEPAVIFQEVSP